MHEMSKCAAHRALVLASLAAGPQLEQKSRDDLIAAPVHPQFSLLFVCVLVVAKQAKA